MRFCDLQREMNARRKCARLRPIRERRVGIPGTDWRASQMLGATARAARSRGRIRECVTEILQCPWRFLQLREAAFWRTGAAP